MAAKHVGLGRGLGDLFASTDDTKEAKPLADGTTFEELPLDRIVANAKQPRTVFDEDALAELVGSISEVGVLQPIVVRRIGATKYELVMGERRFRASHEAGLTTIPAIVRGTADDAMLRDALLENLHRADLNPLEEARAYQQLLDELGCSKEELATRIQRSRPQISNTLRLLNLPLSVQRKVAAGTLSSGHARALLGLPDQAAMEFLAERIIAEGLSVRSTEEIVAIGEAGPAARGPRTPRTPSQRERALASDLSDRFDTRVKVNLGRHKGKITIEFATDEDLDRIMALMPDTL
ncbi:MAG: ParB/RepB/Spo0J family partition protein [Arachnia sp.]